MCAKKESSWGGVSVSFEVSSPECDEYPYIWDLSIDNKDIKCMIDQEGFGNFKFSTYCGSNNLHATYTYLNWPGDGSRDKTKCTLGGEKIPIYVN